MTVLPERCAPLIRWSRRHPLELVGPPGVGKSWLVRRWADTVPDVVWTSLDGVTTADGVVHELAVALDVDDEGQAFPALGARAPSAWVLDDAEGAAEALVTLQARFPANVPVLVASRRRVGLRGSSVVDVGPLDHDEAVELFVARAGAARHRFDPETQRDAIDALCRELDGLPLAIELAAARVRALTVAQIVDRLTLDHLKDRRRSGRHHSLRQALASTVDALSAEARHMLAGASVFLGGFSFEALEAAGAGGLDPLEELMDAGLLQRVDGTMLRLLGPVRAFAAELPGGDLAEEQVHRWLVAQAEAKRPWQDAAFWHGWRLQLARAASLGGEVGARAAVVLGRREELFGPVGGQLARCGTMRGDETLPGALRAALHRSVAVEALVRNDYEVALAALELGLSLATDGSARGELLLAKAQAVSDQRAGEGVPHALLDEALGAFGDDPEGRSEVELVRSIAWLRLGDADAAVAAAHKALGAATGHELLPLEALCLAFLADAERHAGVSPASRLARLDRAMALDVAPPKYRALVATKRSTALADAGRFDEAIAALDGPIGRLEEAGDHLFAGGHRLLQVAFALAGGETSDAEQRLERVPRDLPHYAGVLWTLRQAQVAHAAGDVARARASYMEVEGLPGEGYRALRSEALAFRSALDGERCDGLLDGVLERAHAGPELQSWVDARGRWEARLLARLLRPAVQVASNGTWFQVGTQRHALGRKPTLVRVLAGLAERAGRPVPLDEVLAFGWPGEAPKGSSGRARVHVAISTLRKLGLQGALWTAPTDALAYVLEAERVEG